MLPTMTTGRKRSPRIAIVGTGKLGTALALSLRSAGYPITEIVSRAAKHSRKRAAALARRVGARGAILGKNGLHADLVWLCVPDGAIVSCARSVASMQVEGKVVLHSSGAFSSDELAVLRKLGARVASVHPMMTFVAASALAQRCWFRNRGGSGGGPRHENNRPAAGGESFLIAKKDKATLPRVGNL